jgi:hypothetical protein
MVCRVSLRSNSIFNLWCVGTANTGAERRWSVREATGNILNMAGNTALLLIRGSGGVSMGERRKEERSTGAVAWSGPASGSTIDPLPRIVHTGQICISVVWIRGVRGFFTCQNVEFFGIIKLVSENLSRFGYFPGCPVGHLRKPKLRSQYKDRIKYPRPLASKCLN